jgi:hypothetical protein
VGIAKSVPDSRTPRRFSAVKISTALAATHASCPSMNGNSDFALCTPDEIDTATVST